MGKNALVLFLVFGMLCVTMPVKAQEAAKPAAPATAPAAAPAGAGEEETDIIAGKISTVDAASNTVTVTDEAGKSYTLTATKEETSIWKGDNTIELSAVQADDPIELEYYKNKDGKLVAIWIDVLTKEAAAPAEAKPAEAKPEAAAPAAPAQQPVQQ